MALEMVTEMGTIYSLEKAPLIPFISCCCFCVDFCAASHGHVMRSCSSTCALLQVFRIQTQMQELGNGI